MYRHIDKLASHTVDVSDVVNKKIFWCLSISVLTTDLYNRIIGEVGLVQQNN